MLPIMNGLTLYRKLRGSKARQIPILMLTARDTLPNRLSAFDAGADDYLVKPFALEEHTACLDALIKRNCPKPEQLLRVADLELDLDTMTVRRAGQVVEPNRPCM
jgi:DNA-binding response OmpR family regulator